MAAAMTTNGGMTRISVGVEPSNKTPGHRTVGTIMDIPRRLASNKPLHRPKRQWARG